MWSRGIALVVAFATTGQVGSSLLSNDSGPAAWFIALVLGTIAAFTVARVLTPMLTRQFATMMACRDFQIAALWVGWNAFPRAMRTLS